MQQLAEGWRVAGECIAFVPTMGALHDGHAHLLREARRQGSRLVLSLFVNPTQFGPTEDYACYPRTLTADQVMAEACGVDAIFMPQADTIYPETYRTFVTVDRLTDHLCGPFRPHHFRGVATIVCKLFQIVQPHRAYFGEKDFQQLQIIRRMVADLMIPIEIVGIPTVRETDGLALSSRNRYLSAAQRAQARAIPRALFAAQAMATADDPPEAIVAQVRATLASAQITQIDYISVVDPETLAPVTTLDRPARLCVAVQIGPARLIDNVPLG
ncbi:MAG: pantoate--beta-alanine ligase [Deltaproteobacteria bacterium]|nr:pantoate--beta-alanine ligase [Deltaproteobacteria bacterium]